MEPMRTFMLQNTSRDDLASDAPRPHWRRYAQDIPTPVVFTGFCFQLRAASSHQYIPFVMVDVVVASSLLGMGMMMLPPVVVSLPFKLLVFVLMDGWSLLVAGLVGGIQ